MKKFIPVYVLFLVLMLYTGTFAKAFGKITGKVIDKETNEPLPGTNVIIEGTSLGAATDTSGTYMILQVPPGKYTLIASMIGYSKTVIKEVLVKKGKTTTVNFALIPSVIEGAEVTTTAEHGAYEDKSKKLLAMPEKKAPIGVSDKMSATKRGSKKVISSKELDEYRHKSKLEDFHVEENSSVSALKAAAHDDNEEFAYYLDFLKKYQALEEVFECDFSQRFIIRIVDGNNQPIMNQAYQIVTENNKLIWESITYSNGENLFFPEITNKTKVPDKLFLKIRTDAGIFRQPLKTIYQNLNVIQLNQLRRIDQLDLDLAFILDTTGSMADEIKKLKDTIYSIYSRILNLAAKPRVRFALILYRDRGDEYITQKFDFTTDIDKFQMTLERVQAAGGGDTPEDLQSALKIALEELSWNKAAIRLNFVIADAPPHTDYGQEYDYLTAAKNANARGMKFYTIGASGLNIRGEYIFRQLAALTYGQFIFLTYGETGESDGTGPGKVSHHTGSNYQSRNLDDLVVNIVDRELSNQLSFEQVQIATSQPESEKTHLNIRIDNIWQQIDKQLEARYQEEVAAVLLPFEIQDSRLDELSEYLLDLSIEHLLKCKHIKLIERQKLNAVLKEQGLSLSGATEETAYNKIGKLLNSELIFAGRMHYLGIDRILHLRAIYVNTGQIVAAARIRI